MKFPNSDQIALFKATGGAISTHEMYAICYLASLAPVGVCCELGSNQGKSGIAAASGLSGLRELHAVDPLYDLTNLEAWSHSCQGHPSLAGYGADLPEFNDLVRNRISQASECSVSPVLHGDYSLHAIPEISAKYGKFAYVFIDSDVHEYGLCRAECDLLMDRMVEGGIIAMHDLDSQFVGVRQVYQEMVATNLFVEVPIPWDTIKEEVDKIGGEAGNSSWHHVEMDAPCFVGAIKFVGEKGLPYFKPGPR